VDTSEFQNINLNTAGNRIFLIGFMGTGKSHWGKIWANRHRYHFLDLDEAIEIEEQSTIAEIFEKRGEDYFRQKEAIKLRTMDQYTNTVISCGGGAPCFFDNINWMNVHGSTILLKASPIFILNNILSQQGKRPLVNKFNESELFFYIEQKLKERNEYYEKANIKLDAENINEQTLDNIISTIE
jgi:shikimate kinase